MDQLAEELGMDRFEIRRKNLISDDQFPYPREGLIFADGLPVTMDSGQYFKALDLIEEKIDAQNFPKMQEEARKNGKYLGLGLAYYVEGTGLGPYEGVISKFIQSQEKFMLTLVCLAKGKGMMQFLHRLLLINGVAVEDVILTEGDGGAYDWGVATFASRAAVVSGNAIHKPH